MNKIFFKFLLINLFLISVVKADIQLIKKENNDSNTTLLVIAGIHGNEPGSYFAASILSTHYDINSKNLWVIPNLNKKSIQANKRGLNGDMNRKFASLKKNDPDKEIISNLKKIILEEKVSLLLNLHDGHGFYRKDFQGSIFNPNAWGQTCVIDQCKLDQEQAFGDLNKIASTVKDNLNLKLLHKNHAFNVKNTKTKFDDEEMQLSLTYFAVTHNKPAFAIESSKDLSSLSQKVYYQLLAIEEFMHIMDISYTRKFDFNEKTIHQILQKYGNIRVNNNISLELSNIKKSLSYIPIKSSSNEFEFSNPLGNVKNSNGKYFVFIGNKHITTLKPQYFQVENDCPKRIEIIIDGESKFIDFASTFVVNDNFKIVKNNNIRVNVIGFQKKNTYDESDILISRNSLSKRFSIDKDFNQFRIEFYKDNKFCSMSVVQFKLGT